MPDVDLQQLIQSSSYEGPQSLDAPSASALAYLASLNLADEDIELLLGEAPGLSWTDIKKDMYAFFVRLGRRVARIVCNDGELRESINQSVALGAEAAWVSLVAAVVLNPASLAAAALKPLAVALVQNGVGQLCREAT